MSDSDETTGLGTGAMVESPPADASGTAETPLTIDRLVQAPANPPPGPAVATQSMLQQERESVRGALAMGLLWLLSFTVGISLLFVALGQLDGTVLLQTIFPSLIALTGTALGFYFGGRSAEEAQQAGNQTPRTGQ